VPATADPPVPALVDPAFPVDPPGEPLPALPPLPLSGGSSLPPHAVKSAPSAKVSAASDCGFRSRVGGFVKGGSESERADLLRLYHPRGQAAASGDFAGSTRGCPVGDQALFRTELAQNAF
jgi:hypothetical protein